MFYKNVPCRHPHSHIFLSFRRVSSFRDRWCKNLPFVMNLIIKITVSTNEINTSYCFISKFLYKTIYTNTLKVIYEGLYSVRS